MSSEAVIKCGPVRLSKRSIWRALSLSLVHAVIILHYVHWKATGTTVTPVEPSEAMQTLEQGAINAGFILFSILILSTLVLGRFFCGWGCHVVAYQDLCGWLLKKAGINPKPFRSRLLVWVPVFVALYMFALPTIVRWIEGSPFPGLKWHLTTQDFWQTFPGFWIGALTFAVCGFLIVYVLGNKGFCTYGCPYGAFFYHADRVAPGKIRVTDACEHCGHCTASCTSNVRVHEEVKHFGMVVDAGCMKCFDCIDVCPKGALYYGFGPTSLSKNAIKSNRLPKEQLSKRIYDFTVREEVGLALLFAISFYAYRGLYDGVPLLLSAGLSAITAYVLLSVIRLAYHPNVRVQRWQLKSGSKLQSPGVAAAIVGVCLTAFLAHSSLWQWHYHEANRQYAKAEELNRQGKAGEAELLVRDAISGYEWCSANGLAQTGQVEARLGTAYAFIGKNDLAQERLEIAMQLVPQLAAARYQYARVLATLGKRPEALEQLRIAFNKTPDIPGLARDYALALAGMNEGDKSLQAFEVALKVDEHDNAARIAYGLQLAQMGRTTDGETQLRQVISQDPKSALAHMNLGLILAESQRMDDALRELQEAVKLEPSLIGARVNLARLASDQKKFEIADGEFERIFAVSPYDPAILRVWAEIQVSSGRQAKTKAIILVKPREDVASWYRLVFLYLAEGQTASAEALYRSLLVRKPDLPQP